MTALFASKPQAHWCELLEGTDACFAPVLTLPEAAEHPHNRERGCFVLDGEFLLPSPAPRFSLTPQEMGVIPRLGQHNEEILGR